MCPHRRTRRQMLVTCASGACSVLTSVAAAGQPGASPGHAPTRSKSFWTAIVDSGYVVPAGLAPIDLLLELGRQFGNPDPEVRDRCGYGITARWVVREKRLSNHDLQRLAHAWTPGLLAERDADGGDPVLLRSFSALGLSLVVAAELQQRALDASSIDALVRRGAEQLRANSDRRGFDAVLGWVHVTAHTADLLKFLGRHPSLTPEHQRLILDGVRAAVVDAPAVFQWGEDERLSRAVASVLRRDDVAVEAADGFLDALKEAGSRVDWERPLANGGVAPALNAKAVLKDLHLVLSVAGKDEMRRRVLSRLESMP